MDNSPVLAYDRLPDRHGRRLARAKAHELALIRAREDLAIAKVEAIGSVGRLALVEVAGLSLSQGAYAQQNPQAAGLLQLTAQTTAFAMNRVIESLERELR